MGDKGDLKEEIQSLKEDFTDLVKAKKIESQAGGSVASAMEQAVAQMQEMAESPNAFLLHPISLPEGGKKRAMLHCQSAMREGKRCVRLGQN